MHTKGMPGSLWTETVHMPKDARELKCVLDQQENHHQCLDRSACKLSSAACLGIKIMGEEKKKKSSFLKSARSAVSFLTGSWSHGAGPGKPC